MRSFFIPYALLLMALLAAGGLVSSCNKGGEDDGPGPMDTTMVDKPIDFDAIGDTYADIAPIEFVYKWGPHNVHDPSVLKEGNYFYSYSTDVAFGETAPPGIQIRRSKNLVQWQFVGWAFDGLPQQGAGFIQQAGGTPFTSLWAPYIMKVGSEFRLYYSLSSPTPRLSVIGLAVASNPLGPWTERGLAVTSTAGPSIQTNAIDPTVVVTPSGSHWLYYGSAWDGIYALQLNPATGLAATNGDKGRRIAQRGFTGNAINGNIEGPEIIYQESLGKYFLFIAYDWLETKYNVRVGRADSPEGPFYDFNGKDLNEEEDNVPMILAPYRFNNHSGWQGTAHCSVFSDGARYFMAHQGRPGANKYFMDMHVRKVFWTEDGWPVVSPERYAALEQTPITTEELAGSWELILLGYQVVPGYAEEQVSPDFQTSGPLTLSADGTFNGNAENRWAYNAPWLRLDWAGGRVDKLHVERGRDWENSIDETLLFTGLNEQGQSVWGKKRP
ncbi:MAG: arabinan endo-1,5-alpha-L-arabinosidase [Phaeodactylibacter sp.]|nr:arabinan endo-1,5-alpha-L-arabinosidase [Phaeodactylibacter sp.]